MALQLKEYSLSIRETLANIKLAIKRRDGKAAIGLLSGIPALDHEELWKLLRHWSVIETRLPDNNTLVAVKTLYDNYLLDPKKDFLERADDSCLCGSILIRVCVGGITERLLSKVESVGCRTVVLVQERIPAHYFCARLLTESWALF